MGTINKMNIDNCDLMDNLVPLWEEKNLTERERVLTYVCVVLNERCQNLSQRVSELELKHHIKLTRTTTSSIDEEVV